MTHNLIENVKNKIVNVGHQEEIQIETVAKCIMDIMEVDPTKLEIKSGPIGSAKRRCPDTSLVRELTKFTNYTPLEKGLRKTVESLI